MGMSFRWEMEGIYWLVGIALEEPREYLGASSLPHWGSEPRPAATAVPPPKKMNGPTPLFPLRANLILAGSSDF